MCIECVKVVFVDYFVFVYDEDVVGVGQFESFGKCMVCVVWIGEQYVVDIVFGVWQFVDGVIVVLYCVCWCKFVYVVIVVVCVWEYVVCQVKVDDVIGWWWEVLYLVYFVWVGFVCCERFLYWWCWCGGCLYCGFCVSGWCCSRCGI